MYLSVAWLDVFNTALFDGDNDTAEEMVTDCQTCLHASQNLYIIAVRRNVSSEDFSLCGQVMEK